MSIAGFVVLTGLMIVLIVSHTAAYLWGAWRGYNGGREEALQEAEKYRRGSQ